MAGTLALPDEAVEAGVLRGCQAASADPPGQGGDVGHLLGADQGPGVHRWRLNLLQVTPDLIIRSLDTFNLAFASENKFYI